MMRITEEVYCRIRHAICALGCIPYDRISTFDGCDFEIYGTGFLVRENLVLTNRHVIQKIKEVSHSFFGEDVRALFLSFDGDCTPVYVQVDFSACFYRDERDVPDPAGDWALVELNLTGKPRKLELEPVPTASITVGDPVAACGYLLGNDLLFEFTKDGKRTDKRWRYGPVLQRGWISSIAPYDECPPEKRTEFLLDLKSGYCMSGSPVFDPASGKVFGMIHSSIDIKPHRDATQGEMVPYVARAIPVSVGRLEEWIASRSNKKLFI